MTITATDRLEIKELSAADASFITELVNTPEWLHFIGDRGVKNNDDAITYINNGPISSYKANNYGLWLVALKDSNEPIGICGLVKRDFLPHPDIGFAFLSRYTRKGYATESAAAVMKYASTELKLPVIAAITTDDNSSSLRLLFKLGFQFIGMVTYPGEEDELMLLERRDVSS